VGVCGASLDTNIRPAGSRTSPVVALRLPPANCLDPSGIRCPGRPQRVTLLSPICKPHGLKKRNRPLYGYNWFQARRAGISSAGCRCKVKSERPGGPTHRIYYATHGYASGCCVSPPGIALDGCPDRWLPPPAEVVSALRACIVLVAICGYYSQAALRAVGPLTPPPLTPPAKAPVEKGGQAVGWSGR
jgi:hypothetical protein